MKNNTPTGASCKVAKTAINEINKLNAENENAAKATLDRAIRIGQLLTGIKDNLAHGEWLPWLKANITFSQKTANNYMRLFQERDTLKLVTVTNLAEAYALLSPPAEPEPESVTSDTIALEPADFQRFNRLSPDNRLIVETTMTIFHQQGRAVTPDDVVGLIDRLEVARN